MPQFAKRYIPIARYNLTRFAGAVRPHMPGIYCRIQFRPSWTEDQLGRSAKGVCSRALGINRCGAVLIITTEFWR